MKLQQWKCSDCGAVIYMKSGLRVEAEESACLFYWIKCCFGHFKKSGKTITIPPSELVRGGSGDGP